MDPESGEMSGEEFTVEDFDMDFEYDAPRFYDFSRPELDSEKEEAELWFESSGSYPPSDFSLMSNWRNDFLKQFTSNGGDYSTGEIPDPTIRSLEDKNHGFIYYNETVNDVPSMTTKSKSKSTISNISTLTRPTVSFLARQNKPVDTYSAQLLRRCQRSLCNVNDKTKTDTKRQKLEADCLRKVSRLDQAPFVRKLPGKAARVNSNNGRSKVTIPREPNFHTAQRAGRHRSNINSEPEQNVRLKSDSSKRHTTNKNILEASSTSLPKRNVRRPPDFQAFHLRTSLRATQRSSNAKNAPTDDSMRENDVMHSRMLKSRDSSKDRKLKGIHSTKTNPKAYGSKVCPFDPKTSRKEVLSEAMDIKHENNVPREFEDPTDTGFPDDPAIESFIKLCINSDSDIDTRTPSKVHKSVMDKDMGINRSESRSHGKDSSCRTVRKPLLDVNRSLEL